jgi:hypothetical protein
LDGADVDQPDLAEDPIIVYGAPRSGTTFLRAVLSEHPDVFLSMETRVFDWAYHAGRVLATDKRYVQYHRQEFLEALRPWLRWFLRDYYRRIGGGKFHWGDKHPHYAANVKILEEIRYLFPGTRFIHITRDGRDVVTSLLRRGWVDLEEAHNVWLTHVRIGREFGASLPPDQYFELRYEDLVEDGVGKASEVFDFLGIELDAAVVAYCERQLAERTPLSEPTRETGAIGRLGSDWSTQLTEEQQRESLALLGETLAELGYLLPSEAPL